MFNLFLEYFFFLGGFLFYLYKDTEINHVEWKLVILVALISIIQFEFIFNFSFEIFPSYGWIGILLFIILIILASLIDISHSEIQKSE
jgi:uncharacterized membrane protein